MTQTPQKVDNLIVGLGLAGSAVAWTLYRTGQSVFVVDSEHNLAASRVAAGLVTPVTGKRLVKSPEYEAEWTQATEFYRWVEEKTGTKLFKERPMIRLFSDETARDEFRQRSDVDAIEEWCGVLQKGGEEQPGIKMSPAGRLDVEGYLNATKRFFTQQGCYEHAVFEDRKWRANQPTKVGTANIKAGRLILATGAVTSSHFADVPNNPSRGDILTVRIPDYQRSETVHRSIWIAAEQDGCQTVGSTYDWKDVRPIPTEAGKQEVLQKLGRIIDGDVKVIGHKAGVRPTMKDYEPVVGDHPDHPNVYILNGLGSKGTLRAPTMAAELLTVMEGAKANERRDYRRLLKSDPANRRPLTQKAQERVARILSPGDLAVDATAGNGFDTTFLAEVVGDQGKVIAFDVQQQAIESTAKRLAANGYNHVELKNTGHENLLSFVAPASVAAVMFNLGYLPRSDHSVKTTAELSVKAIGAAVSSLKTGGILTVLCYRGHEGGMEEFEAVERLLTGYADRYDLQRIDSSPAKKTSPVLFVLTT